MCVSMRAVYLVLPFISAYVSRFKVKVQGFFICHIIVIQGIIRSEM